MAERSPTTLLQGHASQRSDGIADMFVDYELHPRGPAESFVSVQLNGRAQFVAEEMRVSGEHNVTLRSMKCDASSAISGIYRLSSAGALS
jgi:hypothetical protein